jgi:hypothetical protein
MSECGAESSEMGEWTSVMMDALISLAHQGWTEHSMSVGADFGKLASQNLALSTALELSLRTVLSAAMKFLNSFQAGTDVLMWLWIMMKNNATSVV